MSPKRHVRGMVFVCICICAGMTQAANLRVTNVAVAAGAPAGETYVEFDISWDASWRSSWDEYGSWTNWDAAWVFVKYRGELETSWSHATLSTNDSHHFSPAGSELDVGLTGTNGIGVFLYRSAEDFGSWTNTGVKLRWRYAADGVANSDQMDISVHAVEMVYVPEGAFAIGDGNGSVESANAFHVVGADNTATQVNANLISNVTADSQMDTAIGIDGDEGLDTDNNGSIDNAGFPTGYKAFYCMKYMISQGQYAAFLNQLSGVDATARAYTGTGYRHTIGGSWPTYTSIVDRACGYLIWPDGAAYADWSGLRPMTELELEKACRGPAPPQLNEYAWGNTTLEAITGFTGVDGSGTEIASSSTANANYGSGIAGPVRCGIFATASSARTTSGSTYWGIMEMSGQLSERPVTIGNSTGRAFTGLHGDGELSGGIANVANWPSVASEAAGTGFRGGGFHNTSDRLRLSGRAYGATQGGSRHQANGWRAVRTAP